MPQLALIRHGQSEWNLQNRFTGWVDVDLTETGTAHAKQAGDLLKEAGFVPQFGYTSVLKRAIKTLNYVLDGVDQLWIPVEKTWRLNERHYGGLTGLDKAETKAKHGEEQVQIWRRSYDIPPPLLSEDDERHPRHDPRYAGTDADLPAGESLKTTLERVEPYWSDTILPRLAAGEDVIVGAHGNSLRALVKLLFQVGDQEIVKVEIPTGNPLLIELDETGAKPLSARYLDESRAQPLPALP
jgi:2,3-bisphosphoglycerate-dependent phosphoglycerate mutase